VQTASLQMPCIDRRHIDQQLSAQRFRWTGCHGRMCHGQRPARTWSIPEIVDTSEKRDDV
jgi:hypothetical protein